MLAPNVRDVQLKKKLANADGFLQTRSTKQMSSLNSSRLSPFHRGKMREAVNSLDTTRGHCSAALHRTQQIQRVMRGNSSALENKTELQTTATTWSTEWKTKR